MAGRGRSLLIVLGVVVGIIGVLAVLTWPGDSTTSGSVTCEDGRVVEIPESDEGTIEGSIC